MDSTVEQGIRYFLCCGLAGTGDETFLEAAIDLLLEPTFQSWFSPKEWNRLAGFMPEGDLASKLAFSPQPHAYRLAVELLVLTDPLDETAIQTLQGFLQIEGERMRLVRIWAAERLHMVGLFDGLPLLLHACHQGTAEDFFLNLDQTDVLCGVPLTMAKHAIDSVLLAGDSLVREAILPGWLRADIDQETLRELVPLCF